MTIEQTRKQAYDGDVDACIRLMQAYAKGDGVDKSLNQAKAWGHKAITLIASGSKYSDVVKGKDCNELHSLAIQGNADAALQLSFRFATGDSVLSKDIDQAQAWASDAICYYNGMSPAKTRNYIDQEKRDKAAEAYRRKLQRKESNRNYRRAKRNEESSSDDTLSSLVGGIANGVSHVTGGIADRVSQVAGGIADGISQAASGISSGIQSSNPNRSRVYYDGEEQQGVLYSVTKGITNVLSGIIGVLAVLYVISPVDVVPDAIPVAGWLDDVGIVGGGAMIILILQSFRKIVAILDNILRSLNKAITIATIIAITLIAILGVLIYHFFIMAN